MAPKPDKTKSKTKDPSAKKSGGTNSSSNNTNKAKKKKWSKGKTRDKLNNAVLFDAATYGKLYKEVPNYRLITPAVVSERLRVCVSLAGRALRELLDKGLIRRVVKHRAQMVYTRNQATTKAGDDEEGH